MQLNFQLIIFSLVQIANSYGGNVTGVDLIRARSLSSPTSGSCECMDYWDCVTSNGNIYSYCGISDIQVCCFHTGPNKRRNLSSEATSKLPSSLSSLAGNEIPPTTIATTPADFPTTFVTPSIPPDVDYFYSLESGDGDLSQITTEPTTITPPPNDCGKQAISWKLDSNAEFREWPWHIALLEVIEDVYICGGALISPSKVVTAAHCVKSHIGVNAPKLKVRAGEYDITTNSEEDPYFEVLVEKIVMYPNFNNSTLTNDIALLMLRSPLNYSMNIRPICLPSQNADDGLTTFSGEKISPFQQCVVTGWGRTSEDSPFSTLLKEIPVPLWSPHECLEKLKKNFGPFYTLPETAICAGERGHDACDGDGGGPLACFNQAKGHWSLVGIVSFGIGCGLMDNPGVYTSLIKYVKWLDALN